MASPFERLPTELHALVYTHLLPTSQTLKHASNLQPFTKTTQSTQSATALEWLDKTLPKTTNLDRRRLRSVPKY